MKQTCYNSLTENALRVTGITKGSTTVRGYSMSNSSTKSNKYHGKPCVKCGATLRYKLNHNCVSCLLKAGQEWRKNNLEKDNRRRKRYRKENKEKERIRNKNWHKNNSGKNSEYSKRWRKNNPQKSRDSNKKYKENNREKMRNDDRTRRLNNIEKYRKKDRQRYWNNVKKERERSRKWAKDNPEKNRVRQQRRRAHKQNNVSEPYDFKAICMHYDNLCVRCEKKKPLTIDHIKPVSKGGPDIVSNIQPLCLSCNSIKHTRHIDYRPDVGPLRWIQKKLFR